MSEEQQAQLEVFLGEAGLRLNKAQVKAIVTFVNGIDEPAAPAAAPAPPPTEVIADKTV